MATLKRTLETSGKKELTTVEELDPRWAKFVDLYLQTGNAKQSAIEAGFTENYADVITSRFPEKVRKSLVDALDHKGITSDKIAEKVGKLLEGKKDLYFFGEKIGEVDDFNAIDKGLTHALKIRGDYAPDKSITLNANVNITPQDPKAKEIADKYEAELLNTLQDEKD
jgi:hypothetical protein